MLERPIYVLESDLPRFINIIIKFKLSCMIIV
jgi:hypothetical protein